MSGKEVVTFRLDMRAPMSLPCVVLRETMRSRGSHARSTRATDVNASATEPPRPRNTLVVDKAPPAAFDGETLAVTLHRHWSIDVDSLTYLPKGAGSFHWRADTGVASYFVTVDDLDTKPWLWHERDGTFLAVAAAYDVAWMLLHEEGLELVVAPIASDDRSTAIRLEDRYSIAVFPFVDGEAGTWGDPISADERDIVLRELARLHRVEVKRRFGIPRRHHEVPERALLIDALESVQQPWPGSPLAQHARRALAEHVTTVFEMLARFDALAAPLNRSTRPLVLTHGEPHPGNLLRTSGGLRLVDWDTVAFTKPERDLWMLDLVPGALDAYETATGHAADRDAVEAYRLRWTLSDIAWLTSVFRSEDPVPAWVEAKWTSYLALLAGGKAEPYVRQRA